MTRFPVTCINLARATTRRESIETIWRPILGDMLEFMVAVDGREVSLPPLRLVTQPNFDTNAAAACLASHLAAMRQALERGVGPAGHAIMEDDVEPVGDIDVFTAVAVARAQNPELDILSLAPALCGGWDIAFTQSLARPASRTPGPCLGAQFIWYSERGMRNYVRLMSHSLVVADSFCLFPNDGRLCRLVPPVVRHAGVESTIGYIRELTHAGYATS